MATAQRVDPYRNFKFLVEIDRIVQGGFLECSGFGSSVEVIEYREGGEASTVRKLPGKVSFPDITLKWGVTDSRELYDWHLAAVNGAVDRRNGSIILQDDLGNEATRWNFFNAWPTKWDGPSLSAKGNEVAVETLILAHEGMARA